MTRFSSIRLKRQTVRRRQHPNARQERQRARNDPGLAATQRFASSFTTRRPAAPRAEKRDANLGPECYLESEFGTLSELSSVGTPLENPYVYDASARELKAMASQGLIKIVEERRLDVGPEGLISHLTFERLR
jgi:hypothetical protein